MSKYAGQWTANLQGDAKKNFEELLGTQNKVLDRLREICYNMYKETEKVEKDFDNPSWALRQASLVGKREALEHIMKLCTPSIPRDQR